MKVLILFAAVLTVASAINPAAIYRSRCSEGASYWCKTASHADECGAIEYCIQNFWRGKLVQESAACQDCEAFVNAVHNVLEQTTVQDEILDGIKQACVVMDSLSDLCQTLVETLGAEVLQKLVTELTAAEVCEVLQFCQEKTALKTTVNDEEVCTLCKDVMSEANALVANVAIQQDIENTLLQFCPLVAAILPNCAQLIQDEFPTVVQFLLTYLNPDSCTEIGICSGNEELRNVFVQIMQLKKREGSDLCTMCKNTMMAVDDVLSNAAVQAAVRLELDQLCYTLGTFAPVCVFAVNKYSSQIISAIATYMNPDTFCPEFRFCTSDENVNVGADMCVDCKTFVGDIDGMLTNQTVQNLIVADIDVICEQLGDFADQCKSYVDQYGYIVFDFLASNLNPQDICTDIQFCPASPERRIQRVYSVLANIKTAGDKIPPRGPSKVCTDCEQFFTDVQSKLNDPNVQNTILNAVESVCTLFGPSADECRMYVEQYGGVVIQFIVQSIDPDTVCNDLGFCMSSAERMIKKLMKKKVSGPSKVCTDCEQFFTDVQTKLNDPDVQNTILNDVESACTLFGPSADECRMYVEQYGGVVIQFIVQSIDPDTVCNDLGFCMSSAQPLVPKMMKKKVTGPSKVCTDCDQFFTDVQTKLSDPNVQDTIVNAVESVCTLFGPSADECRMYVEQYGGLVVQFVVQSMDPDTLCNDIGFCMSATLLKQKLTLTADMCADCKAFFTDINGLLLNQTVEAMITADIVTLCADLGTFADQCKMYVNQYAPLVFSLLASELNPDQICTTIEFCPAETVLKFKPTIDNSQVCSLCESTITAVETYISSEANENMIINELDAVLCASMGFFTAQCKSLVKAYTPQVINIMLSYMDPTTLCTAVKLCPGASTLKIIADPQFCADCKAFITDVDSLVSNQTIQAEILAQIEDLCSLAGTALEPECKLLVQTYGPTLFAIILSELDPTTDCTDIGLCPGSSAPRIAVSDHTLCSDCKNFLTDIDSILSNQTLENEIIAQLEDLCSMAGSLEAECKLLVETYGPAAFAYILSQLDPTTFCTEIGVCPGNSAPVLAPRKLISLLPAVQPMSTLHKARPVTHKKTAKVTDTDCDLCKTVVGLFIPYIESNKTVEEILDAVSEVCDLFPESTEQECKNYVSTYGYLIIELLENEATPEAICQEIGVCTSAPKLMDTKPAKHLKQLLSKLPTDDTFCTLCEIGVAELETILSSNKSKEEIKQEVEKLLCGNLPAPINAQCLSFMQIYGDVLVQLLIEQLEPTTFCAEIGLCSSANKQVLKPKMSPVKLNPECVICEYMVTQLDDLIKENSTEAEIRMALDKVCSLLPGTVVHECDSLVDTYTEEFVKYLLLKYTPKAMCSALGICDGERKVSPVKLNPECIICEYMVTQLDDLIKENSTEAEIRMALDKVCSLLPGTVVHECDSLIDTYTEEFVKYLLLKYSPKAMCSALGICDGERKVSPVKVNPECVICEYMVSQLDDLIKENSTEAEIRMALDKVCSFLPGTVVHECDSLIDTYTEEFVKYLLLKYSPKAMCSALGICDGGKKVAQSKKVEITVDCILCEYIMQELDDLIENNSTEAEIEAALNDVCNHLPSTLRTECTDFIENYFSILVSFLTQELDPKKFCVTIKECAPTAKVMIKDPSSECAICEFVMSELDSILSENATQEEIKAALDGLCADFPATIRAECTNFVDTYEPLLIKLLVTESPQEICTLIALCKSTSFKSLIGTIECDLCQTTVREFMIAIQEPSVSKEIVAIINETCAILPANLSAECYSYVDQYGDLVTQFIAQFFDPITSCTLLEACPYPDNSPSKRLLGQHECTRGPGYWCASMENAQHCNMVEHCKRHAWN